MGSETFKLILAEIHIAIGLAAVAVLASTGHLDATITAGFIGGLLGIGGGASLVAYNPTNTSGLPVGSGAGSASPKATGDAQSAMPTPGG